MLPVLSEGKWDGGWGVPARPNGLQQLSREGALPKTSPRTSQLQGQRQATWNPSLSQAQCLWQALLAGTLFIYCGKLFMAAMKQPLGESLRKECVVVRVGCRSDPRRDFPRGQWASAGDRAQLRPLAADSTAPHPGRKQTWGVSKQSWCQPACCQAIASLGL